MSNVTDVNEVYLKTYAGEFTKNSDAYIGRSSSESTDTDIVLQKIVSLHIHYPAANNTGYNGTLTIRISTAGNTGVAIFSCKIKPGETVIPISNKVQPIYLSNNKRIIARLNVDGSETNADYIMCVEEHRSI
jgi:hypothetical protein